MAQKITWNAKAISSVAETISLAFASDPLITWLRPAGPSWADLDKATVRWQERRVLRAVAESTVYAIPSTKQTLFLKKGDVQTHSLECAASTSGTAYAAVAIVAPPSSSLSGFKHPVMRLCCTILDLIAPAHDEASDMIRVMAMMDNHEASKSLIACGKPAHYIEVVAVAPEHQGQGLGGRMMRHILSQVGSAPVFLECTDESNVKFYEKYGFSVVKQIELASGEFDKTEAVKVWLMLRN